MKNDKTEVVEKILDGRIPLCPSNGCGFKCCKFDEGNYIVLYPGEYENAVSQGSSLGHLDIIDDDYHGGKKAVCKAKETATCDNGYKPLDCKSYPFFPGTNDEKSEAVNFLIKGNKCPLMVEHISYHKDYVKKQWDALMLEDHKIGTWLSKVKLIGYDLVK